VWTEWVGVSITRRNLVVPTTTRGTPPARKVVVNRPRPIPGGTMTTKTEAGSTYVLGTTQREYERVRRQAEVWQRAAERVLDRVDPAPGSGSLGAGCGHVCGMHPLA